MDEAFLHIFPSLLVRIGSFAIVFGRSSFRLIPGSVRLALFAALLLFLSPALLSSASVTVDTDGAIYSAVTAGLTSELARSGVLPFLDARAAFDLVIGAFMGLAASFVFFLASIAGTWLKCLSSPERRFNWAPCRCGKRANFNVFSILLVSMSAYLVLDSSAFSEVVFALGASFLVNVKPHLPGLLQTFQEYKDAGLELLLALGKLALLSAVWMLLPVFFLSIVIDFLSVCCRRYFPHAIDAALIQAVRSLAVLMFVAFQWCALRSHLSHALESSFYGTTLHDFIKYMGEPSS